MGKIVLFAAAVPLLFTRPALAGDGPAGEPACREPHIGVEYRVDGFGLHVSVPAGGCPARQDRQFVVSASVSRVDTPRSRTTVEREVVCGPFGSAADGGGRAAPSSCDLDVAVAHPAVEQAEYDVEVSYPGPAADRTDSFSAECTSDGVTATCERP